MPNIKNLILALVCVGLVFLQACGGGSTPPTPEEQRLIDLALGPTGVVWNMTSVTFEGSPSTDFIGMTLTLRLGDPTNAYATTNGDPVFGSTGTWALNGTSLTEVILDGNADNVFVISNFDPESTPATLTLTVNWTDPGGTIEGTNGTYVFNFEHN